MLVTAKMRNDDYSVSIQVHAAEYGRVAYCTLSRVHSCCGITNIHDLYTYSVYRKEYENAIKDFLLANNAQMALLSCASYLIADRRNGLLHRMFRDDKAFKRHPYTTNPNSGNQIFIGEWTPDREEVRDEYRKNLDFIAWVTDGDALDNWATRIQESRP